MNCKTHATIAAQDRCAGCAEPFCENCLVEVRGQRYCNSCKIMAIDGPPEVDGTTPCAEASEALKYAIISFFCCGLILGPMAVSKGLAARRAIQEDPNLTGAGKANVAIMLGVVALVLWLLNTIARAMHKANL
jgi:hypothetical protein